MTLCDIAAVTDAKPKRGGHNGHEAVVGRCPACAAEGRDTTGNHLLAWADEEWLHVCRCPVGHEEGAILRALGWSEEDRRLAPRTSTISGERPPRPSHDGTEWVYVDGHGRPALIKTKRVSWRPAVPPVGNSRGREGKWLKDYPQSTPDGTKPGERGQKLVYNLVEVVNAVKDGRTIYVNEGEKACDSFIQRGFVATCQPNGAGEGPNFDSKWTAHHTAILKGAARVVIVADRDRPTPRGIVVGEAYASYVASQLRPVCGEVVVVQSATRGDKDDAYDHFLAGYGVENFVPMAAAELVATVKADPETGEVIEDRPERARPFVRTLWSEMRARPPKQMLIEGFLGKGDSMALIGKRKSGKSAVTFDMILRMLAGNEFANRFEIPRPLRVGYFTEEGIGSVHTRMEAANREFGLPDTILEDAFWYFEQLPQLYDTQAEEYVDNLVDQLVEEDARLDVIILDTFIKSIDGAKENDNSEVSRCLKTLGRARRRLDCASMLLHHAGKDGNVRGASAIDGDVDEMYWVDWDEETGERKLRFGFAKDLSAWDEVHLSLRSVDIDVPGSFAVEWEPSRKPTTARDRIVRAMRRNPDDLWTMPQIRSDTGLNTDAVTKGLAREIEASAPRVERVKPEGAGSIVYRLTEEGKKP